MSEDILSFKYKNCPDRKEVYPCHKLVNNWIFPETEEDEATLCNSVAFVAEKNGISATEMHHLFPAILRMLMSKSSWSGLEEEVK